MQYFDREYLGRPLWEIDRPQPEFVRLEEAGEIRGRVLDVGCGTGENTIWFAGRGHESWGIDFSANAIAQARSKAAVRGSSATFREANALSLGALGERFDTVTDSGLFHTLLDKHRAPYSESLRAVLRPGGRFFLLCFSEEEPSSWGGPRRISAHELTATFDDGWRREWIRPARYDVRLPGVEGKAWLGAFTRR